MDQAVNAVFGLIASLLIGLPMLLFGRRLFWLLGGLAMAILCLTVITITITLAVLARYPAQVEALGQALQSPDAGRVLPATLAELDKEASEAFESSFEQLGSLVLIFTLIGGVAGALILIRMPRVASALVGFVAGIYLLLWAFNLYSVSLPGWLNALLVLAAGVVIAVAAWRNPDTSLIVLSVVIGAELIVMGLNLDLNTSFSAIVWLGLMLLGIIYQTGALRRRQAKARRALVKH